MAMNKKEQAEMKRLRDDLSLARAMRWPSYPMPQPMTREDVEANKAEGGAKYGQSQMVARGWFYNAYLGSSRKPTVSFGCSSGISHSSEGDTTTTQNMGRMFFTKRQALEALRIELTEQCAKVLVAVDAQLFECED